MDIDYAVDLIQAALVMTLKLSLPLLVVGLIVGLAISLFQAVTQIQEQTLVFIPKMIAVVVALIFLLPTLLTWSIEYMGEAFRGLSMVGGG